MAFATTKRAESITTLELNEAESIVLLNVMMRIAGPMSGPRGICTGISAALQDAGVPIESQPAATDRDSIEFVSGITYTP